MPGSARLLEKRGWKTLLQVWFKGNESRAFPVEEVSAMGSFWAGEMAREQAWLVSLHLCKKIKRFTCTQKRYQTTLKPADEWETNGRVTADFGGNSDI
jgi:hypothetical protein